MIHIDQTKTTTLPAAAATTTSAAIDLSTTSGGLGLTNQRLHIRIPTIPVANTKKLTFAVLGSTTLGGSYTAVQGYGNLDLTGTASGVPEQTIKLAIHPATPRFLKVSAALEASGGTITGSSFVFEVNN